MLTEAQLRAMEKAKEEKIAQGEIETEHVGYLGDEGHILRGSIKTILDEFYRVAFRKKIYRDVKELQEDLDHWLERYNTERVHQGKRCGGRTPMETFEENLDLAKEKIWDMSEEDCLAVAA